MSLHLIVVTEVNHRNRMHSIHSRHDRRHRLGTMGLRASISIVDQQFPRAVSEEVDDLVLETREIMLLQVGRASLPLKMKYSKAVTKVETIQATKLIIHLAQLNKATHLTSIAMDSSLLHKIGLSSRIL